MLFLVCRFRLSVVYATSKFIQKMKMLLFLLPPPPFHHESTSQFASPASQSWHDTSPIPLSIDSSPHRCCYYYYCSHQWWNYCNDPNSYTPQFRRYVTSFEPDWIICKVRRFVYPTRTGYRCKCLICAVSFLAFRYVGRKVKKNTIRCRVEEEGLPGPQCTSVGSATIPSLALGASPA